MVKVLSEYLEGKNIKDFLEKYSKDALLLCCQDIDDLTAMSKKELDALKAPDLIKAILNNINNFGINHMFQILSVKELKGVCERLDLKVSSTSKDKLVESIIEKKNYKKKSKPKQEHSEVKPDIKKGISKVDLQFHFQKPELEKWLKDKKEEEGEKLKDLKITGKKNELIDRILKILEGDYDSVMKKKRWQKET